MRFTLVTTEMPHSYSLIFKVKVYEGSVLRAKSEKADWLINILYEYTVYMPLVARKSAIAGIKAEVGNFYKNNF